VDKQFSQGDKMRYYIIVWKDYNGFHKKRIQSYADWYSIVNDIINTGIAASDIMSISLDTNPPLED